MVIPYKIQKPQERLRVGTEIATREFRGCEIGSC